MAADATLPREVRVRVEVPRGSFAKRGAHGRVEFLSPVPCPFHYGSVVGVMGADGDAQDALIVGSRAHCPRGSVHQLAVRACVHFIDEGLSDDKWICSEVPLDRVQELALIAFFRFYGAVKATHDRVRGKRSATGYRGFTRA
ncbi:MAG: inorganic diphosphatase [Sandaracinaceae bacterium]|nr:inorganic diphosphatase [Sandaracinaceae bacterium]